MAPDDQFCGSCGTESATARAPEGGNHGHGCPNCASEVDLSRSFCAVCGQVFVAPRGVKIAGLGRRIIAYILELVLFVVTLGIGYLIWWLFTLRNGQTPAKQLLGIRVIHTDGRPSKWGWTFLREFGIKGVVVGVLNSFLIIVGLIDVLWALWDKNRQAIHDKIMKTLVVDDREFKAGVTAEPPAPV